MADLISGVTVTDIVQAIAAAAMVAFTYALLKVSQAQAQTAEALATIARGAERAYLSMQHAAPGLRIPYVATEAPQPLGNSRQDVQVLLELRNSGNTPAWVTAVSLEVLPANFGQPLPDSPPYGAPRPWLCYVIRGNEIVFTEKLFRLQWLHTELLRKRQLELLLIGYVDYEDIFGRRFRHGYARRTGEGAYDELNQQLVYALHVEPNPAYTYELMRS